jgi:hypothetical protein
MTTTLVDGATVALIPTVEGAIDVTIPTPGEAPGGTTTETTEEAAMIDVVETATIDVVEAATITQAAAPDVFPSMWTVTAIDTALEQRWTSIRRVVSVDARAPACQSSAQTAKWIDFGAGWSINGAKIPASQLFGSGCERDAVNQARISETGFGSTADEGFDRISGATINRTEPTRLPNVDI